MHGIQNIRNTHISDKIGSGALFKICCECEYNLLVIVDEGGRLRVAWFSWFDALLFPSSSVFSFFSPSGITLVGADLLGWYFIKQN